MSNTNNATNQIGLEKADMSEVIDKLNDLLSSYHMFYINVRGYHWNLAPTVRRAIYQFASRN